VIKKTDKTVGIAHLSYSIYLTQSKMNPPWLLFQIDAIIFDWL
jgi:hypothetical protein